MSQFAFPFDVDPYNPSEFIQSNSNREAYNAVNNWPQSIWGVAPYPNALIIRGPESSGKTFLAKQWSIKTDAFFIELKSDLTEDILLRNKAFVIDGVDADIDEEKILHNFNAIHEHNKYLLITTNKIPEIRLPDLSSRMHALNIIDIDFPDDALIRILIFKLFSNYSIIINKEIINYLVKIMPRTFPEIIDSIYKINEYALRSKSKITIPLIKIVLNRPI